MVPNSGASKYHLFKSSSQSTIYDKLIIIINTFEKIQMDDLGATASSECVKSCNSLHKKNVLVMNWLILWLFPQKSVDIICTIQFFRQLITDIAN